MQTHFESLSIENNQSKETKTLIIKLLISLFFNIALQIAMISLAVGYKNTFPNERPSLWSFWLIKAGVLMLFQIPLLLTYKLRPFEQKRNKKVYVIYSLILTLFAVAFWLGYAHFSWYK